MNKKTTEISVNTSSGAEKVETIEKEVKTQENKPQQEKKTTKTTVKSAKGASAMGGGKAKAAQEVKRRTPLPRTAKRRRKVRRQRRG